MEVSSLFFTFDDVVRFSRTFKRMPHEISEELRGWNWSEPPVLPPSSIKLFMSDVAGGFCPTGRIAYLRYVLRKPERPPTRLAIGAFIHDIYHEASRVAKALIYGHSRPPTSRTFREEFTQVGHEVLASLSGRYGELVAELKQSIFDALWNYAANTYASALDRFRSRSPFMSVDGLATMVVPMTVEYPVDGSLIGLSRTLRIDAVLPPAILVELKTRTVKHDHEVAMAGYALAYESQYEVPIDYAVIINLRFDRSWRDFKVYERIVLMSDALRSEFIERRDVVMRIVEEGIDPGMPKRCDRFCPYIGVCRGARESGQI